MTSVRSLVAEFENLGGVLAVDDDHIKIRFPEDQREALAPVLARLREHRDEITQLVRERSAEPGNRERKRPPKSAEAPDIPSGAVLVAPRYDSRPVKRVPSCWCCRTPYKLDHVQNRQEKLYAHLEPGCKCLDRPQALNCCGLCLDHCPCKRRGKEQEVAAS